MAGSFILVGRAQGRSERGVFDRPFTLPVLIIPAFPLSGLNTAAARGPRARLALPSFPSLPEGCNHCHTGVLDSLVRMHDTVLIHKHTHMHPSSHVPHTFTPSHTNTSHTGA